MKKEIKVCLLDFDGTLVTEDILSLLCGLMGKGEESKKINDAFNRGEVPLGPASLVIRINFLSGMKQSQITEFLDKDNYLMLGVIELMNFFKDNNILTILASGNITPVLLYYQKLLGIDFIVGPTPDMDGETILGITESAFSSKKFKLDGIKKILSKFDFKKENIVAIGDSPADKQMFEISDYSIAINPKGDIAEFADVVIGNDLRKAIDILKSL